MVQSLREALPIAKSQKRTIILNFTGKEWCPACIYLRTKIFASDEFIKAAGDKYVEAEVIFPRLPEAVRALGQGKMAANERLLNEYHITSGFPTMVLHDEAGLPFAVIVGARRTPAEFLKELDDAQALRAKRDAAFAKAADLQGIERAKLLVEGLNALPVNCRSRYDAVVNEINAADPENTLGYKDVLLAPKLYAEQIEKLTRLMQSFTNHTDEKELRSQLEALRQFRDTTPNLQPEVDQMLWCATADVHALLREYEQMTECTRKAIQAAPDSERAPRLRINLQYMEEKILPHAQELRDAAEKNKQGK